VARKLKKQKHFYAVAIVSSLTVARPKQSSRLGQWKNFCSIIASYPKEDLGYPGLPSLMQVQLS